MIKTIFIFLALFLAVLVVYEEHSAKMQASKLAESKLSRKTSAKINSNSSSKKYKQDPKNKPAVTEVPVVASSGNSYVNSNKVNNNSKNTSEKKKEAAANKSLLVNTKSTTNTNTKEVVATSSVAMPKEKATNSKQLGLESSNKENNELNSSNKLATKNDEPSYFSNLQWEGFFGVHYTSYDATFDVPVDSDRFFVEHPNITFGFNVYKPTKYLDYGFGLSLSSNSLVNYYTGLSAILYPNRAETSIAYFPIASLYLTFKKELTYKHNTFVFRTKFGFVSSYKASRSYNDYIYYDLPLLPPVSASVVTNEGIDLQGKGFASFSIGYEITNSLEVTPYINLSSYKIDAQIDTCLPLPGGACPKLNKTTVADTLSKEVGLMLIYKF
ncbi:MAEBL protein [Candidatus Hepatincola sp. Pdp]